MIITGTNSKSRYPFYDKSYLSLCFGPFSRPSISGNRNSFFISLYSKKQNCLEARAQNLIYFFLTDACIITQISI
uniref:photosystem I subunit VIII n=1 Tax=Anaphalis flaccida TaxID=1209458 RepID=UPI0030FF1E68